MIGKRGEEEIKRFQSFFFSGERLISKIPYLALMYRVTYKKYRNGIWLRYAECFEEVENGYQ